MTIARSEIERALDDLVAVEGGVRFQHLVVILAKKRWPELIASQGKWDCGLDAHALPRLGLATSITSTLAKIRKDARRARGCFPTLTTLIFYTAAAVTNHTALKWQEEIRKEFDLELIIVPREDVIAALMDPANSPLCRSQLGLAVPVPEAARDTLTATMAACNETVSNWLRQSGLNDRPLVDLGLVRATRQRPAALSLDQLADELRRGRRVVLEGAPGAGKTTTLLQLARTLLSAGQLCLVVDLPAWIESGQELFAFQTLSPPFRSHSVLLADLDALVACQPLVILLNGWNEVSEEHATVAAQRLRMLDRGYPGAGILLATRPHALEPFLAEAWHVAVQPLRRAQRRTYISNAVGARASELLDHVEAKPTLDALTRTPLILSEVVKLFEAGQPLPEAKLDVLRAMADRIERSAEHQASLAMPPLSGLAHRYLEALAVEMMKRGVVDLADPDARTTIAAGTAVLREAGQLMAPPEPQAVLTALCAHHVLQRFDHPATAFRFQHQQFQEFYAALRLLGTARALAASRDEVAVRRFQRTYLNRPAWGEVLAMIAEAVGTGSPLAGSPPDSTSLGEALLRWSIPVAPLLAAELARLAGRQVWERVGPELGALLRRWYTSPDRHHRHCALTAMLASGSEDFRDIVVPLLIDPDQQVRLGTYRAVEDYCPTSLGSNWREIVTGWGDEQRADFVGEVLARAAYIALAEGFATNDPSPKVRRAAIHAVEWVGARDALARILETLDGPELVEVAVRAEETEALSEAAIARLRGALRAQAAETHDAEGRIRLLRRLIELGDLEAADDLRTLLASLSEADLRAVDNWMLLGAVKTLRTIDSRWTDAWIAERLANGMLWPDRWLSYVDEVPEALSNQIFEELLQGELDPSRREGAIAVLSRAATEEIAARLWQRLIEILPRSIAEATGRHEPFRSGLRRQLEDAVRSLSAPLRISSALKMLSSPPHADQSCALIQIVGRTSDEETLRAELPDPIVRSLHDALVGLIPFALREADFGGELKLELALAIARVGGPGDAAHIRQLVDADIERRRRGIEALRRGERNDQTNGASMSWSNWYVRALCWLGQEAAEPHLLDLLSKSGFEEEAAGALAGLAIQPRPLQEQFRAPLIDPASDPPKVTDERHRARYAAALRIYVEQLLAEPAAADAAKPTAPMKALAVTLAWMDGSESRDLVLRVIALPGEWDGWLRTDALEQLLRVHRRLPTEATFAALDPTIEHTLRHGIYDEQHRHLVKRCLSLLAAVDDPERGIGRIREVMAVARLHVYEFRDLVRSLARNGSEQALDLLIELASGAGEGFRSFAREWITAVACMDLPRARSVLMASVDPRIDVVVPTLARFPQELSEQIAQLATSDPSLLAQIRESCALDLTPVRRELLSHVVEQVADEETVLAALALIRDDATPPLSFHLVRAVESVVVGREPLGGSPSTFTLVPRRGTAVRSRLFAMLRDDPARRLAAFALLGTIEEWRLDHGRPLDEPRHPDIESGLAWPPLDLIRPDQDPAA